MSLSRPFQMNLLLHKCVIKANPIDIDKFIGGLGEILQSFLNDFFHDENIASNQLEAIELSVFETLINILEHSIYHYSKEQIFSSSLSLHSFLHNHEANNFDTQKIDVYIFLRQYVLQFIFGYQGMSVSNAMQSNRAYGGNGKKIIQCLCIQCLYQVFQAISKNFKEPGNAKMTIFESIGFIFRKNGKIWK